MFKRCPLASGLIAERHVCIIRLERRREKGAAEVDVRLGRLWRRHATTLTSATDGGPPQLAARIRTPLRPAACARAP